jgi:ABC-type phosphate transport system substrate-binding protein
VVVRNDGSGTSEIFTKAGPGNGGQGERLVPPHTR